MNNKSSIKEYRLKYIGDLEKTINFIKENTNIEHHLLSKRIRELNVNESLEVDNIIRCICLSKVSY